MQRRPTPAGGIALRSSARWACRLECGRSRGQASARVPDLAGPEGSKALGRDLPRLERRCEIADRLLDSFVREAEGAPVVAERLGGAGVLARAHGFLGV